MTSQLATKKTRPLTTNLAAAPARYHNVDCSLAGVSKHMFMLLEGVMRGEVSVQQASVNAKIAGQIVRVHQSAVNRVKLDIRPARSRTGKSITLAGALSEPINDTQIFEASDAN